MEVTIRMIRMSVTLLTIATLSVFAQAKWTRQITTDEQQVMDLVWTGNRIVAVCDSMPGIFVSKNGTEWEERGSEISAGGYSVVWNGKDLIVNAPVMSSDEGETWKEYVYGKSIFSTCIRLLNGRYFVAGWGDTIYSSDDATSWTPHALEKSNVLYSIAYNGERYVAVGGYNGEVHIVTSTDGITWSEPSGHGIKEQLRSVTYSGKLLVVAGINGAIYTSTDGLAWIKQQCPTTASLLCAAWLDSTLYITGDSGIVLSSSDGITWERKQIDSVGALFCIAFTGTQFVAGGYRGIYTSPKDGITSLRNKKQKNEVPRPIVRFATSVMFERAPLVSAKAYLLSGRVTTNTCQRQVNSVSRAITNIIISGRK